MVKREQKTVKLSEIKPNPDNPRVIKRNQLKSLQKSLSDFPEMMKLRPIVVDEDGVILGGNMRYQALLANGATETEVETVSGLTPEQKREFIIKDNVAFGDWDWDALANEWDADELEEWGLDIPEPENVDQEVEEVDVPEVKDGEPKAKLGDIYQLGEHRLICGDSTDIAVIDRLMDGVKADIAFTSPPYNAGTTATETAMGKTTKYNGNDDNKSESEYREFLNAYLHCAMSASQYVFMNVQSIANNKIALIDVLADNKDIYADTIIWDKQNGQPAMANNVLNSVFEYIHIFSEKANRAIGTIDFRGTIDNILHLPPQRNNEYSNIHNATFSVEFASWFISRFAKETVLDSFGGTGTTLIACEQLNRKCYMAELDPHYVDVIIQRWEDFTGKKAKKIN